MPEERTEQEQERKPLTTDDVAKFAAKEIMPEDMNAAQRCFWYAMRDLYRGFRAGTVSKQDGEETKAKLLRQYDADMAKEAEHAKYLSYMNNFWRSVEIASTAYATEPGIDTADAFFEAVYHVPRKNKEVN